MALGLGLATGRPAVVLTTSGTAAVELHPAVVEAHQAKVPLLVVHRRPAARAARRRRAADDRPARTCTARRCAAFVDPGVPDAADGRRRGGRSPPRPCWPPSGRPPGPVHLNLPFREPLVGRGRAAPAGPRPSGGPWHGARSSPAPTCRHARGAGALAVGGPARRDRRRRRHRRPRRASTRLAAPLGWPVLADPRSGCRLPRGPTVSHFDAMLRVAGARRRSCSPEVVLRLGSLPASKVLGQWLAGLDAWQVGVERDGTALRPRPRPRRARRDRRPSPAVASWPTARLARPPTADAEPGCADDARAGWAGRWAHADAEAAAAIATVLAHTPEPTEPAVARDVAARAARRRAPGRVVVDAGPRRRVVRRAPRRRARCSPTAGPTASTAWCRPRSASRLGSPARPHPTARCSSATSPSCTTPTASSALRGAAIDLTIVVVDNDGGGIFSFLPQAEALDARPRSSSCSARPTASTSPALVAAHGLSVPGSSSASRRGPARVGRGRPPVASTSCSCAPTGTRNVAVHDELHAAVAAALSLSRRSAIRGG